MDVAKDLDCQYVEEHDLVSAYLAGRLSEEEAEAFEKHYFGCERCWAEVQAGNEVRAALKRESGGAVVPLAPRRRLRIDWTVMAAAAAVLVAIAAAVFVLRRGSLVDNVVAAAPPERRIEARLTGGFAWKELNADSITRGEAASPEESAAAHAAREKAIRAATSTPSTPDAFRAAGLAELLRGRVDQAIDFLNDGKDAFPRDARLWSDLSAAHFARFAAKGEKSDDLNASYEAASRAVELDPHLPEAQFNKALAASNEKYRNSAIGEWERYLALDSSSPWADEARRHRDELLKPSSYQRWPTEKERLLQATRASHKTIVSEIVRLNPTQSRALVEDELLADWTLADRADDLRSARAISEAIAEQTGDRLLTDAIAHTESAIEIRVVTNLKTGYSAFRVGKAQQRSQHFAAAENSFRQAQEAFAAAGNPFQYLALHETASCRFDQNDLGETVAIEQRVIAKTAARYATLFARAQWLLGLAEISRGRPSESLEAYDKALHVFERIGDAESAGFMQALIAENYQILGETTEAAHYRRLARERLARAGNPRWLYVTLSAAGEAAASDSAPAVARMALLEAASVAPATRRPDLIATAFIDVARVENSSGNRGAAAERVREAEAAWDSIEDPSLRRRTRAELDVARSEVAETSEESLESLASAIAFYQERGWLERVAELHLARGRIQLAANRRGLAEREFRLGLDAIEVTRGVLTAAHDFRTSFFEHFQNLFDQSIDLLASEGRWEEAAEIVERSRARTLVESFERAVAAGRLNPRPLKQPELSNALPADTAVVEYAILDDRLLIFVFRSRGVTSATISIRGAQLEALAADFAQSVASGRKTPAGGELYRSLVASIRPQLMGVRALIFVPDKSLNRVPFAALFDTDSKRFLIDDFEIGIAPSVSMYVRCLQRDRDLNQESARRVLVVENPRFDQARFPRLGVLRAANAEARQVVEHYPDARILGGADATRGRFIAEAAQATLIHYAGHAFLEPNSMLSSLVLAPDPAASDSGLLYAHEISLLRLPRARMVILAGCDTARGPTRGPEGVLSLARAFLAAGVPVVLGTLSPVDDRETAFLLSDFHQGLARGLSPLAALRQAQLTRLNLDGPDRLGWASFELIGGPGLNDRKEGT